VDGGALVGDARGATGMADGVLGAAEGFDGALARGAGGSATLALLHAVRKTMKATRARTRADYENAAG
jgi:hypothetical protein